MRKCNYGEVRGREVSYARRLAGTQYPRFHAYIDLKDDGFTINLHLDQKKACYEGTTAHSGEYDGELVKDEGDRLEKILIAFRTDT